MFSTIPNKCHSHLLSPLSPCHVARPLWMTSTRVVHKPLNHRQLLTLHTRQNYRLYSTLRRKGQKEKVTIGEKLRNLSSKGLLKSAEQLTAPNLVETNTTSESGVADSTPLKDPLLEVNHASPREIALQEYVQLCKSIREGRTLETSGPAPRQASTSKKASKSNSLQAVTSEINDDSATSPKTTKKSRTKEAANSLTSPPLPSIPVPASSTEVPDKVKRRAPKVPKAALTAETPSQVTPEAPSDLPTLDTDVVLPPKWGHQFEMDLSVMRQHALPRIEAYDKELRAGSTFDRFAPLESAEFWQSSFEWDSNVNACASKYIESAIFAKELMDPSANVPSSIPSSLAPAAIQFKKLQRESINMALAKQNVLVALATGGGKTMCYVLPALLERGLTVVVSPMIALIQDQLTLLDTMGIPAAGLSCQMSAEELENIYAQLVTPTSDPPFKLVYVTPERIGRNERFMNVLVELHKRGLLQRVVVDEAHCISEWGHDFRKDYRRLSILRETIPNLPIMATTGTCTPAVRKDIAEQLRIDSNHYVLQTSFNRPNLWFQVSPKSPDTPMADMLYYILNHGLANECGIVFAMTTNDAERLAEFFSEQGLLATFYHGAMSPQARQDSHARWARGDAKLMCTTVAFGLGIDKSNVRYVLHSTMPTSLEAYYQQAGRAGRDGNASDCVLFFQPKDRIKIEHVIKLNAHLLKQRQRADELKRIQEVQETQAGKRRRRRSATPAPEDSSFNVVDIVDIPDNEEGIVRLLREDGSELMFDGFHPDYNEIVQLEDDPLDEFVRQMKTEKLDDVSSYCKEKKVCRRVFLMRFFGQPFVSNQCEHSCDVCAPKLKRVTDRLTKKGHAQWTSLKAQRDKRRAELAEKPLHPAVAKIQALIQETEDELQQEARNLAKKADEDAYEAQFGATKRGPGKGELRPARPTKVGTTSPLARKLRKGRMSTLGDPSDYETIQERLENIVPPKRAAGLSESATSVNAPLLAKRTTSHGKLKLKPQEEDEIQPEEQPTSTLDELLQSIAKITEAKVLRRGEKKRSGQFGRSFDTKRLVHHEDEDGYVRTSSPAPSTSTTVFDEEHPSESSIRRNTLRSARNASESRSLLKRSHLRPMPPQEDDMSSIPMPNAIKFTNLSDSTLESFITSPHEVPTEIRTSRESRLFSEVKAACLEIAKEERTLLKNVMSQQTMKSIVAAKPQSTLELAAVKGIGPRRAQRFSAHIIPIFSHREDGKSSLL